MASTIFSPPNMIKKYLVIFSDLFNRIEIPAADGSKLVVPIRLGTSETLFSMAAVLDENRNRIRYSLPMMGFSLTSMEFDSNRPQTMLNSLVSTDRLSQIRQPVPYNFNVDLFLLCNRASELFQIMEIILPMYQSSRSYPLIEYKFTDGSSVCRDVIIELTSPSFEINGDVAGGEEKVFSSTLSFKMQGWLHNSYVTEGNSYIENIDIQYEEQVSALYENLTNKPYVDVVVSSEFAHNNIDLQSGGAISNTITEI